MKAKTFIVQYRTEKQIKLNIKKCKKSGHFQQVVYSIHGEAFTQICFDCQMVWSSLK